MTVNQVYRVSHVFNAPGADGDMIFNTHYRVTEVTTDTNNNVEGLEIATAAGAQIASAYMSQLSDVVTYTETRYIGISDPLVGGSVPQNTAGNSSDEAYSWRNCPIVSLKSGLRGRSYNGRIFLIAPPETQANAGVLVSGYLTAIKAALDPLMELTGATSSNKYSLTVYSETLTPEGGPPLDNIVQSMIYRPVMGTQKSRQLA